MGCVETFSENHLVPVLECMLHQFPFRVLGFHCDNGSEFINERVAQMLNKLLVKGERQGCDREFSLSHRATQSRDGDCGLSAVPGVESNASTPPRINTYAAGRGEIHFWSDFLLDSLCRFFLALSRGILVTISRSARRSVRINIQLGLS